MNIMKKSLTVVIILLFIGVAVAPGFNNNVVKAAEDDFVEVTPCLVYKTLSSST